MKKTGVRTASGKNKKKGWGKSNDMIKYKSLIEIAAIYAIDLQSTG